MKKLLRTYSELITFPTFEERLEYLKLDGVIGEDTFGFNRYLNQKFYDSDEWKSIRREVIIRDNGCDLGVEGYEIMGAIYVHHINPITPEDIINFTPLVYDLNNLISCSRNTHDAITYGTAIINRDPVIRFPGDTCPWRNKNGY